MKKFTKLFVALALMVGILLPSIQAAAQSSGLSITPRRDYTVQKGTTKNDTLPVTNPLPDEDLTLNIKIIDFTSKGQTGTPLLDVHATKATTWSLKDFLKIPDSITLKPGETQNVPISITIPASQGAGTYYSAIQYSANNSGDKNVTINAGATTLMFVNVPGDAKEQLTLTQLGAFSGDLNGDQGAFKLFYFGSKPKLISYMLKNDGNVAEQPVGSILIKNNFTGKTTEIKNANPMNSVALLGQERRFDSCIKQEDVKTKTATGDITQTKCAEPNLAPGRYTITLNVFYGQANGKSLEVVGTSSFWYLPWWFVAIVLLVVLALVALVWWIVNKVRDSRSGSRRRK